MIVDGMLVGARSWEAKVLYQAMRLMHDAYRLSAADGGNLRWTASHEALLREVVSTATGNATGTTSSDVAFMLADEGPGVEWVSTERVREFLGVTGSRVRTLCAEGRVIARRTEGRWLVQWASVLEYEATRNGTDGRAAG